MQYNKITLSFLNNEESSFRSEYFYNSIFQLRIAFILLIILYGLFGYLDTLIIPEFARMFHIIRFEFVIPILLVVFLLSFYKIFQKLWQVLLFISFIIGGTGISIMTMYAPENYAYYAGMMLIFFAGYFFIKLRFFWATIGGWSVLLIYNIGAIFFANTHSLMLINNNFFFISANLIGMLAAYNIELYSRRIFFLNQNLAQEKINIKEININLEKTVEERTNELLEAKDRANKSEEKLEMMLKNSNDSFVLVNENGEQIFISNAATRDTGFNIDELLGPIQNVIYPDDLEIVLKAWNEVLINKDDLIRVQYRHKHKYKDYIWYEAVAQNFLDNPAINAVIVNVREITLQKALEIDLIKSKEKAEESEIKSRLLIELAPDAFLQGDSKGTIIGVNNKAIEMFGYSQDEIMSMNIKDLFPVEVIESLPLRYDLLQKGEILKVERRIKKKDNEIIHVEMNSRAMPDGTYQSFIRDITDRKNAEHELIEAKEKAEESDRLKSAFLANMSHEIRTPMNGILGFAELLKKPNLTGEKQQFYVEIIEKSGKRMLNIINDIIDISKIEAGLMQITNSESNINDQIEYIFTFFKPEAEAKGISLSFINNLPHREAIIYTDREKLYAILTNLVKNSIKFTDSGSIEVGYNINEMHSKNIEFFVRDTGVGIAKDRQDAIFERFVQADVYDEMAWQGAGLGLAITKAYVEMLGGNIWVESELGAGSTFYFTLPYVKEIVKETSNMESISDDVNENAQKLRILIAEDDESSEMLLDIYVQNMADKIFNVRTGTEAIDVCRANPAIDLILMDIHMPDMGGYEATQQIREFNKEVIIIAQTAYGLTGDREKSIEAGCNDYITKPINRIELQSMIKKYFR